uniref:Uncharacterized protein n=1 Tax=Plectus sambesii TaxID=2011161 RepID=A0A914WBL0_9BILA
MTSPKADGSNWLIENNKLTLYDVKKGYQGAGDNAVYQCKAENKHGYIWTNFYLNLLAFAPQLMSDPGQVETVLNRNVTVETVLNRNVTVECRFFGSPIPEITWDGAPLQGIVSEVVKTDPNGVGKLILKDVSRNAEGEYFCNAKNKYGAASGSARVIIRKATRLVSFAPREQTRVAGERIELPCTAEHDENIKVTYSWLINGKPIPEELIANGHYVLLPNSTLVIPDPAKYDTASYTCVASTRLDNSTKVSTLRIKDVPSPPHSAYLHPCEKLGQSAVVRFAHMESVDETVEPVREFWVQYQIDPKTEGSVWRTHPTPVTAAGNERIEDGQRLVEAGVTVDLQPFGQYKFRVIARNDVGDSAPAEVNGECETPAKVPDRNPTGVSAKGSTPEDLVVYWQPMAREEWNGPDFHYIIKYRKADGSDGSEWKEVKVEDPYADHHAIDVGEDGAYVPYEVQVQAVNKEGHASVQPETVKGRSGEGKPTAVVSGFKVLGKDGTTAEFSWNPVDRNDVQGEFKGYM